MRPGQFKIDVCMVSARGWDCHVFTPAQFARARRSLSRCDVLIVTVVGALV